MSSPSPSSSSFASPDINAEVAHAFLEPVLDVLRACTGVPARVSQLDLADQVSGPSLLVTVTVKGSIAGPIRCNFPPAVARRLAAGMMSSDILPAFDSPATADALSELLNVIVGNATGALQEAGYFVELLPPTSLETAAAVPERLGEQALRITVDTEEGQITMLLALHLTK